MAIPKLRFKRDDNIDYPEWEEKRLGDVCKITTGKLNANAMVKNGKYRFYTCASEFYYIDTYAFDTEALLISGNGANVGYVHYYKGKFNAYQRTYVLDNFSEYTLYIKAFLDFALKDRIDLEKHSGNIPYIVFDTLAKMIIQCPCLDEQQKIADFLSNVDVVIQASERELSNLIQQKKAMMQRIFSQELRFKRDDGTEYPEWKEKRLSDLLLISKERNNKAKYTQNDILACSLGTELDKKYLYFGLKATKDSVKNYRVVRIGDIVYTKSPIKGFPNGIIRANKKTEGIVPSLYCVYHNESGIRSEIIQAYFDTGNNTNNYLNKLVNIGARNNVNITDIGLLEGTIVIPSDIEEQQKIADFLSSYDDAISYARQELNHLKSIKKGLLQQMFI